MGKLGGGKSKKSSKGTAKESYREAVDGLKATAGSDWNGPAHPPERIDKAIDSTQGLNTDSLRESAEKLLRGGRPGGLLSKIGIKGIGSGLAGVIGGMILENLLEKFWEWIKGDEDTAALNETTKEAAKSIDDVEKHADDAVENMCSETKSQVQSLCAALSATDKTKQPERYRSLLCAADSLINQCGSSVLGLTKGRDECVGELYDVVLQHGAEVCGKELSDMPAACENVAPCPTEPACVPTPPTTEPPSIPGSSAPTAPAASQTAPAPPPSPAPAPAPSPAAQERAPEPVPAKVATPPEKPTPEAPAMGCGCKETATESRVDTSAKHCSCHETTSVEKVEQCVSAAELKTETAQATTIEKTAESCLSGTDTVLQQTEECTSSQSDIVCTAVGIGLVIAVIGAFITAAEEFLALPDPVAPEPPAPEPAPAPPAPVAYEPPPPPKQVAPEPVVYEPPPPPKQVVPEAPAPVTQEPTAQEPVPPTEFEQAPVAPPPVETPPEQELVGAGQARKAGAW